MKISFQTNILARALGAALLLGAAFTAWGVTVTLDDGVNPPLTCTVSTGGSIRATGDITTNVVTGCIPTATGGGGGTGPFTLTVSPTGTGTGTVTSGDGFISCGTACNYPSYTSSTTVILTATAASGSTFAGWSGGGCSGTGTCTLSMTTGVSVAAIFNTTVVAGACGTLPANTLVVDTGYLNAAWKQQTFLPLPQTITAFKVTVPATFTGRDNFAAAATASALKSKLLVVSSCPGVLTPVGATGCSLAGTDATTMRLSGNSGDASYYCKLTPGATYYVNAVSKNKVTDTTYNCSTTTNCSFYASRAAPY